MKIRLAIAPALVAYINAACVAPYSNVGVGAIVLSVLKVDQDLNLG